MADFGLLGGIGQGLQAGFQSYINERKHQEDTRSNALARALQMKAAGLQMNATGTGYDDTPEKQLKDKVEMAKLQGESENYDKTSPYAGLVRGVVRGQVKQTHPEYTDEQVQQQVPEGLLPSQYEKASGLMKPELSNYYNMQGRKYQADASERNAKLRNDTSLQGLGIRRDSLDLRKSNAAQGINKEVMHDKVVAATDMQQNSIAKGIQQLNSKDKPITLQMLNEIQADYANALAGGRVAAQGTIHDQQMQTAQAKLANLKQYVTGNPAQAATPEQIAYFKTAFNELKGLNQGIRKQRVQTLTQGAQNAYGNQGQFGDVINNLNQGASGEGLIPQESPLGPNEVKQNGWIYDAKTHKPLRKE